MTSNSGAPANQPAPNQQQQQQANNSNPNQQQTTGTLKSTSSCSSTNPQQTNNNTNQQQQTTNSLFIRKEIQRFESVHPNIYSIYDLIDSIADFNLQHQIREHIVNIEGIISI